MSTGGHAHARTERFASVTHAHFGALREFVPGAIWLVDYPVRYFGIDIAARMVVIRLSDGRVMLQSPGEITPDLKAKIEAIGPVAWIVAPGTFHHLHVSAAQAAFPAAQTWICPGLETKRPDLRFDALLGDTPPPDWADDLDQVVVDHNRVISEVVFFHRPSRTLIVVDLIELIGDMTPEAGWKIWAYWKLFRMWNRPRPAPEYTMGWRDRKKAAVALRRILDWDFERIVLQHGALITENAKDAARDAWAKVLSA